MPIFERKSIVQAPAEKLFTWHTRPQAFERLTPPWEHVEVMEKEAGITDGSRVTLQVRQGLFNRRWVAVHSGYVSGQQFTDTQVEGPFTYWKHTHQFLPSENQSSQLIDRVDYEVPLGAMGDWFAGSYVANKLKRTFSFRHGRTQNDLKRIMDFAHKDPLRIVISGASGMIGKALAQFLSGAGHEVQLLVRRQHTKENDIFWNPAGAEIDKGALENVDAVIHLAGESIASGRWSPSRKKKIMESRVRGTKLLAETLASLKYPPKTFICSSAIGFYGNRGDEILTEESPAGKGFLTDVCKAWEEATEPAKKAGIRVVNIRTGIVLSAKGGALPKMVLPMLMGAGGMIGTGNQWMSWISLEDLVGIFHYAIYHDKLSGPVNATAPWCASNKAFTKILGYVLKRPTFVPLPGFVVKILFGEMGDALLLKGQQVKPAKLTDAGFEFLYPDLESALRWELGRFR